MQFHVFLFLTFLAHSQGFGGSEDKFLKKYAMMKIYESCFGAEVVNQIRQEMKAACAKCASLEAPEVPQQEIPTPPAPPKDEAGNSLYQAPVQPQFDVDKLHQAILAYRPNSIPSPFYRPYSPAGPAGGMFPFYSPYNANPGMIYPGFPPAAGQFTPMGPYPLLGHPFYQNRESRNQKLRDHIELLSAKMSTKVRNITCVMQELGYLDENLEPNYPRILERIRQLPVSDDLKVDMQDGVDFCQQFSQCVPEIKKDKSPLSREFIRPMFFFKCYKQKKLEACIMKDVREKYAGINDEDFENDTSFKRQGKSSEAPEMKSEINELETSVYEFLYGGDDKMGIDAIL